ncbi:homocitrate synthase [Paraburkholderia metrosideri]|uniref:Homocitrate synthase n=2 Tax=Paraburkholderia TaxID=1822464 RepID=A0ABW9E1C7_9BURK
MSDETKKLWETSPFTDEAHAALHFHSDVRVTDCTLRDGEQQAGIVFTRQDKVDIARALDRLGIYEIEAGTPASSDEDRAAIEEISGLGLRAKISALVRGRRDDIDLAAQCGVWGARISLPISTIQRNAKLKLDDDQYIKLALESAAMVKERGLECIFSPFDTTRADFPFLARLLETFAQEKTVDRVRIVDTTGCATPEIIGLLVLRMRAVSDIPIEIHCHNDFGLAVANTVAGLAQGAQYMSVTVNGIGERSGNASLEETVLALRVLHGVDCGVDLSQFMDVSRLVEERSGISLQAHKPVVGRGAFAHESGMVVAGLLKDPFTAESYVPELVGQSRRVVLGKKSGVTSVEAKLAALGLTVPTDQIPAILASIKAEALRTKRPIDDDRLRALVEAAG